MSKIESPKLQESPVGDGKQQQNAAVSSGLGGLGGELDSIIHAAITKAGGWLGFDEFIQLALYTPGLGYYANSSPKFGQFAGGPPSALGANDSRSDFVTAPEMTPLFGQTLATQMAQVLQATGTDELWEFGAGTGALALQILDELQRLKVPLRRYTLVEVSGSLRTRQQVTLARHLQAPADANLRPQIVWADQLPAQMQGVVIGNEVLDAMPVKLLARHKGQWCERGVVLHPGAEPGPDGSLALCFADRPTDLRPPLAMDGSHDYVTEIHPQAEGFIRTLADKLKEGAIFLIDYGFPESEYYHPQRHMGTVMCHRAQMSDTNPLADVGHKDITAHVNFTGIAMAGQDAGLDVLGYCTQGRFLMNCGLLARLEQASMQDKAMAQKLILEHEMGELFKVIAFGKRANLQNTWQPLGFAMGDRLHTL